MGDGRELNVEWYLVVFVDVLGQRHLLRQMRGLPEKTDQEQMAEFVILLKKTVGTVKALREYFERFFEGYNRQHFDLKDLNLEQKRLFEQSYSNPLKLYMFSDFIIVFLSLRDDINKVPMRGVYAALASAASTFLTMLASKRIIRGGIDIGVGTELSDKEIYGAALSRAYELESKMAQYPRIIIGDELINYIHWHQSKSEGNVFDAMNKIMADLVISLIAIDDDGFPFLDYLGKGFKQNIAKKSVKPEIIKKAYDFILEESVRCQDSRDSKLAFRYTLLRNYFDHRMSLWQDQ
jgi:hypothetical protein